MNKYDLEFVRRETTQAELLTLLAEEAAELAKAALKLRRATTPDSTPTPITTGQALENLLEESADVCLMLHVLQIDTKSKDFTVRRNQKMNRWVSRIKAKKEGRQ